MTTIQRYACCGIEEWQLVCNSCINGRFLLGYDDLSGRPREWLHLGIAISKLTIWSGICLFRVVFGTMRRCCQGISRFEPDNHVIEFPPYPENAKLTPNSPRHRRSLLNRRRHRDHWYLQSGTSFSNSAFGALNLTSGLILWESPVLTNDTSLVPQDKVKDVIPVGISGPIVSSGRQSWGRAVALPLINMMVIYGASEAFC